MSWLLCSEFNTLLRASFRPAAVALDRTSGHDEPRSQRIDLAVDFPVDN
jgi:hypothetical protein